MASKFLFSLKVAVKYAETLKKNYYFKNIFLRSFSSIRDKNSEFFRKNSDYRDTTVQNNCDLLKCKIAGPGFSFSLKENDAKTDELFAYLTLRDNVMRLSSDQVKGIMCLIANMKTKEPKCLLVLKHLDEKCALSVERWSLDLSLYMFDAWFIILGPKAFRKHYYSAVTSFWSRKVDKCTKNNIIQMLYFIGLSKSSPPFLMEILEDKMEKYLLDILDEECAIAFLSFFKTSKKIESQLLLSKACQIAENFLQNDNRFQLISILKCLRHAQFYDQRLWMLLKDYIKEQHESFNFVQCTNFLAAFASQTVYDENIFKCLEMQGMKILSLEECNYLNGDKINFKEHPSVKSRAKDFARFLWSVTSMGHCMKNVTLNEICEILQKKLDRGEFEMQSHVLVDCIQSLILAGFYPRTVIAKVLQPQILNNVLNMQRDKPRYQMYFVQKCIQIECPELEPTDQMYMRSIKALNSIPRSLHKEISERNGFKNLINLLQSYADSNKCSFKCCYITPHIMIAGIVLSTNCVDISSKVNPLSTEDLVKLRSFSKKNIISRNIYDWIKNTYGDKTYICIEILDPTICIRNSTEPLGLMKTKMYHLKKMHLNVIALSSEEINNLMNMSQPEQCNKIISLLNK